ncbi:ribokinase [Leekyejoonella antrihumi]|uniref:Ribokinase n=1 Tax=Leekyejoonella antrihumi TaxID=1660198 RepID=A0A563DYX4_9MICO|nr:ribokinase [Leekyejoonella antrihumi]TWP35426.1 ribokinase [Leekyejoonella antrihumi]
MAPPAAHVVVVGSINLDLSVAVPRLPGGGETLLATGITRSPGGKGANQAVAAARAAGARTSMVGALGDDAEGHLLRKALADSGVGRAGVATVDGPSGQAFITVDEHGENTIIVVAGANGHVQVNAAALAIIRSAGIVLGQLEVPQDVLAEAAAARKEGVAFVLNAAPSAPLEPALQAEVDVLIVNEHEARDLAGRDDLEDALNHLVALFPVVVITLGAQGAQLLRYAEPTITVAAPSVQAVDTVAAGDTFCGVLAAALAGGMGYRSALEHACAAASLAVQSPGAQTSVPLREEVAAQHALFYGGSAAES